MTANLTPNLHALNQLMHAIDLNGFILLIHWVGVAGLYKAFGLLRDQSTESGPALV
jgi:hypothetical protein